MLAIPQMAAPPDNGGQSQPRQARPVVLPRRFELQRPLPPTAPLARSAAAGKSNTATGTPGAAWTNSSAPTISGSGLRPTIRMRRVQRSTALSFGGFAGTSSAANSGVSGNNVSGNSGGAISNAPAVGSISNGKGDDGDDSASSQSSSWYSAGSTSGKGIGMSAPRPSGSPGPANGLGTSGVDDSGQFSGNNKGSFAGNSGNGIARRIRQWLLERRWLESETDSGSVQLVLCRHTRWIELPLVRRKYLGWDRLGQHRPKW